jgi:flagellar hook-basal body complex protein FliE
VEGKGSIHEAMVAITNAEGSFRLMMEIRNRLVLGINQLLESSR